MSVQNLFSLFTAQDPWTLAWKWAIGPLSREKYFGPVSLLTVAMATKKPQSELIGQLKGNGCLKLRAMDGKKIVTMGFHYHGNQSVAMTTKSN